MFHVYNLIHTPAKMSRFQQHMITNNLAKKLTRQNENADTYKIKLGMNFTCFFFFLPTAECHALSSLKYFKMVEMFIAILCLSRAVAIQRLKIVITFLFYLK